MTALPLNQNVEERGWLKGDVYRALSNLHDKVNELGDDHATFKTVVDDLKTLVNALRSQIFNRALGAAGLAIGGTTTKYKHANQIHFCEAGVLKLSATTADHTFTGTEVITQNLWGIFLISLAGTTWKSTPAGATMAYATEAAAIAAMPAVPANEAVIGYITIRARSTANFTAGTTTLTADNGSGNSQTVNYYDGGLDDMQSVAAVSSSSPASLGTSAALVLTKG
jgi:hypothetical protein